jgi:hypothetical protein
MRYYSDDTLAPHSAITGIADAALRYNTICSGRHIYQTHPSESLLSRQKTFFLIERAKAL